MTTEGHAWAMSLADRATGTDRRTNGRTDTGRTRQPVCGCGQDLDVCTGAHCPRCGTSLFAHAA